MEAKETKRKEDDEEYMAIKEVGIYNFAKFAADKDLFNIRLPLNNPEANEYLTWCNYYYNQTNTFLYYLLNLWDSPIREHKVRPPTIREVAICSAREIAWLSGQSCDLPPEEKKLYLDFNAENIKDAYMFNNYPIWVISGMAGAVMKFGTFEDHVKDDDKFMTFEDYVSHVKPEEKE